MIKKKFNKIFFTIFFFSPLILSAQTDTLICGKISIIQEKEISSLLNKHILFSENKKTISGFRVQIHFGSEREKAKEMRVKFLKQFPEKAAYEIYQQPNFKIRVGDFRTKLEAQKFLKEVSESFPSSFVVQDEIQLPEIN